MCVNALVKAYIGVLIVGFLVQDSNGHTLQDAKDLLRDKLADYNKNLRPVENQSLPVYISVGFELVNILEVHEVQQKVTVDGMFNLYWLDESMIWDPIEYGNTTEIVAESNLFWTPPLVLSSDTEKRTKIGGDWGVIRYGYSGIAQYTVGDVFTSSCAMDITYYPFDQHQCKLEFITWNQIPSEVFLYNTADEVFLTYFVPNGVWELVGSEISVLELPNTTSFYYLTLIIRRIPRYVIINVIIPVMFLSLLNNFAFFIPIDSGERLSFCITLLLAVAVFLTIISDTLPRTSSHMAILSYYLLAVLIISNCITLMTIFNLNIFTTDDSVEISGFWRRLVHNMKCKPCRRRCQKQNTNGKASNKKVNPLSVVEAELRHNGKRHGNIESQRHVLVEPNQQINDKSSAHAQNGDLKISWKDVSVAFDRLCFWFFTFALVFATATLFGIIVGEGGRESMEEVA